MVMQDKETGSYWDHITGKALMGKLKSKQLTMLPVVQTTWSEWAKSHTGTKVLRKEEEVISSIYENYFRNPDRMGMFRTQWLMERLPGKKLVHGIALGPHALAVVDDKLKTGQFLESKLGEESVLVARTLDGGVRAFLAKVDGKSLTFQPTSQQGEYIDKETESIWDLAQGVCRSGELKGKRLRELAVTVAFWFAWSTFYPYTHVVD